MKIFHTRQARYTETILFYLMVAAGLIPLFINKYFVTLDGPAHLYSGVIIKNLWFGDARSIHDLFQINPFPVPNWFSHFLFAMFSTFLPGFLTEKAVIALYLFFTPLIFRKLILHLAPENRIFSWFMVLFVHNQNFYFGFFNLSFGILFLFLNIFYFYKYCRDIKTRQMIILAFLFLLTYFAHLLTFLISLGAILVISLNSVRKQETDGGIRISGFRKVFRNTFRIIVSSLPALILSLIYIIKIDSVENAPRPELSKLFEWIFDIRPLLAISYGFPWKTYTYILFLFFIIMAITHSIRWLKKSALTTGNGLLFSGIPGTTAVIWFSFALAFLLLYLILPNAILLTERLILFFFLFLITWLALLEYPKWVHVAAFIVLVTFHVVFTRMYAETIGELSVEIVELKEAVRDVETGSLMLTLNYKDNWLHAHTTGYAGCDQPVAVLENYEAGLAWFPVKWNVNHYQIDFLNDWGVENKKVLCEKYFHPEAAGIFSLLGKDNQAIPVRYVLITGNMDQINEDIPPCLMQVLNASYSMMHRNNFCTLFKLNR